MPRLLYRYATPLITGLFLVSLVSGVALFLHVGQGTFREMHEWLSLVLVVPFALHLWRNWRPMTNYLRAAPMAVALAGSTVLAVAFALSGSLEGGERAAPPQFALADRVMAATVAQAAPVLGETPEGLAARLAAAGYAVSGPQETLTEVMSAAGADSFEFLGALLPAAEG